MLSFSAFVFSWRMRLLRLKKHKVVVSLVILFIIILIVFGPSIYLESWLDPYSTLNVPNRELHPRAITKLGMLKSTDPFHPFYYTNEGKIQDLMHDLQLATPLGSEQDFTTLKGQKIQYFTLHRAPSRYHAEVDYSLQYYPEKKIVIFSQEAFNINEATVYALQQITEGMTPGWWK